MPDKILGVKIDNLSKKEILEKIESFLDEPKFHQIATINPEFILEAQKNEEFKNILNNCVLNVADGFGIKLAFLRFGKFLKYRFAGVDLMMEILRLANDRGLEIFLAINKDGLSNFSEIKTEILKIFPNLKIFGDDINVSNIQYSILDIRYQILLCNFGAPQQEIFINNLKSDTIRIAMGIGGSFDFLTGKIKRAPKIFRILGLEWLYRFIQEPKYRWKRIFNAVIIFPVKIILN